MTLIYEVQVTDIQCIQKYNFFYFMNLNDYK